MFDSIPISSNWCGNIACKQVGRECYITCTSYEVHECTNSAKIRHLGSFFTLSEQSTIREFSKFICRSTVLQTYLRFIYYNIYWFVLQGQ